jgi:hypothetical protein
MPTPEGKEILHHAVIGSVVTVISGLCDYCQSRSLGWLASSRVRILQRMRGGTPGKGFTHYPCARCSPAAPLSPALSGGDRGP